MKRAQEKEKNAVSETNPTSLFYQNPVCLFRIW